MLRFFILILFISGIFSNISAQSDHFVPDTLHSFLSDTFNIQEVEIISPVSYKYQVGSKTQKIHPEQLEQNASNNLTGLLSHFTPIYIKSNAGGLSGIHFRGTSDNHTAVMIGGLTINSLTLGSANPSNVPVFLFDNVDVLYGSSSASVGSGSIGGSIRLGINNNWTQGQKIKSFASIGSFGEKSAGTKVFLGNGSFESVSRFVFNTKDNDFEFSNTESKNFEIDKFYREKQKFTAINNTNFLQEFNYKFSDKESLTSLLWLADNWHEVQPTMESNSTDTLQQVTYKDIHLRSWIQYNNNNYDINYKIGVGYVYDNAIYNHSDSISTQRIVGELEAKYNWRNIKYAIGLKGKHIVPKVHAYADGIKEDQLDIYSSILWKVSNRLNTTLNLRKQFVTKFNSPFTPALGVDYNLFIGEHKATKFIGNVQRSFRTPTLNDRYWNQPMYKANENLVAEDGLNIEGGIKHTVCHNKNTFQFSAQYFYMDVKNWLMWVPINIKWEAANILNVISKGVELHADANITLGQSNIRLGYNYTYNYVFRNKSKLSKDEIGRQLEYSPKNLANGFISITNWGYNLNIDGYYVGNRFYNQETEGPKQLEAYSLFDITISKSILRYKNEFKAFFKIHNILGTSYQNIYRYAMPETSYTVSIHYTFNNKNKH